MKIAFFHCWNIASVEGAEFVEGFADVYLLDGPVKSGIPSNQKLPRWRVWTHWLTCWTLFWKNTDPHWRFSSQLDANQPGGRLHLLHKLGSRSSKRAPSGFRRRLCDMCSYRRTEPRGCVLRGNRTISDCRSIWLNAALGCSVGPPLRMCHNNWSAAERLWWRSFSPKDNGLRL